ncbi:deoxyUTP pyrophosphatase [Desulfurobacterium thermolithotrophum DSM 11699]|uniref:dUTP diphosphatase n=1 Tax=Desulfurobacterium thermolithotrophum (strain DSM 11699 / BSA) TaxID=868864 RepID=F0S1B0_DESTD|nr:dUTP pyrophosphatase [Desulfurobacterium thermolithotrophum]ADY72841.1 deoxyUTP pyrophosphatase [Desulfurobacterium thermolithotrophum DSM 11699]
MSNWAAGWIYARGLNIEFSDRFLDVAVKIYNYFGGKLERRENSFFLSLPFYPEVNSIDLSFIRGVFESSGSWGSKTVFIPFIEKFKKEMTSLLSNFSPTFTQEGIFITGENADLFVHSLYDEDTEDRSEFFFERYLSILTGEAWERKFFKVSLEEGALPPYKKRISDSGWDLHLIKLIKKEGNLYFFDTGVRVAPPPGFYFDLVPRSSIYKSGFILANSVGIIDMTYRGTIKVPLIKVDASKPDPELPWRAVQLIPRKFFPIEIELTTSLDKTIRGEGGFGSTG